MYATASVQRSKIAGGERFRAGTHHAFGQVLLHSLGHCLSFCGVTPHYAALALLHPGHDPVHDVLRVSCAAERLVPECALTAGGCCYVSDLVHCLTVTRAAAHVSSSCPGHGDIWPLAMHTVDRTLPAVVLWPRKRQVTSTGGWLTGT